MTFLHRSLSEDMNNETSSDSLCYSSCINELKHLGSCSTTCLNECPTICKVVVVTSLSPPPVIHKDLEDNLQRTLLISASSIFTTLFLLALLVLCFKWYNRRRLEAISRRLSMEEASNRDFDGSSPVFIDHPIWHIRTIGLNPMVISSIKVCKYSKRDGVVDGTDCSVCLSEFEEEEMLRLLPKCKHAFHLSCIDTWLRSHTTCPICRAAIVVTEVMNDDHEHRVTLEETHVRIQEESEDIESDHDVEERDEFVSVVIRDGEPDEFQQRVRRSVSLDSRLSQVAIGREKEKRGNIGSSIVGRSSFLRRTISYSGK